MEPPQLHRLYNKSGKYKDEMMVELSETSLCEACPSFATSLAGASFCECNPGFSSTVTRPPDTASGHGLRLPGFWVCTQCIHRSIEFLFFIPCVLGHSMRY